MTTQIDSLARCGLTYDPLIKAALISFRGKNWIISPTSSYYFIVKGDTPLEVAKQLYNHPVGKTDIRVNGNCTRPAPEGFEVKYYDKQTGKQVVSKNQEEPLDKIIKEFRETNNCNLQFWLDSKAKYIFSDDKEDCHKFIELYHIDSELGLYVFLEFLTRYYENV